MGASAEAEVGGAEAGVSAGVDLDDDLDTTRTLDADTRVDADLDADADVNTTMIDRDYDADVRYGSDPEVEGSARSTVTALSFAPETRANWVNRFPFYDWNIRVIETYTFAVPDPDITVTAGRDLPTFSEDLEPGAVFVEAAGGAGEITAGRVIQHSPVPTR